MKTIKELKEIINYQQTDSNFISYLELLRDKGVIEIIKNDIIKSDDSYTISDVFFKKICFIFGVQLDDELNPIKQGDEDESGIR
jgi:hydrogenase maturation factor